MKNTCISTESKTLYPHEKCRTYVNKTIFARHNNYGPLYFLLVSISFRCPSKPWGRIRQWRREWRRSWRWGRRRRHQRNRGVCPRKTWLGPSTATEPARWWSSPTWWISRTTASRRCGRGRFGVDVIFHPSVHAPDHDDASAGAGRAAPNHRPFLRDNIAQQQLYYRIRALTRRQFATSYVYVDAVLRHQTITSSLRHNYSTATLDASILVSFLAMSHYPRDAITCINY